MVENTWNVSVRQMLDVPRETHRYLIEPLETIYQDARSTTRANLRNILLRTNKTDVCQLVPNDAFDVHYHPISSVDEWRVPFIMELIDAKNDQLNISNIADGDLEEMLSALCTS